MSHFISWGQNEEAALASFEQHIGFELPADYRQFLRENNGAKALDRVFFVEGLGQDVLLDVLFGLTNAKSRSLTLGYWLGEYGDELPEKTLLIGRDPGGRFLMYVTAGEDQGVYYWDDTHFFPQSSEEDGNTYHLADSFAEFLDLLREYEPA